MNLKICSDEITVPTHDTSPSIENGLDRYTSTCDGCGKHLDWHGDWHTVTDCLKELRRQVDEWIAAYPA